eukprot:m.341151 g.341151  ORF g.341151 m.341151 type:complete len:2062 (+) comp16109_c0_seq1:159-6344(+)
MASAVSPQKASREAQDQDALVKVKTIQLALLRDDDETLAKLSVQDLELTDEARRNLLHVASSLGSTKCVSFLLAHAPKLLRAKDGESRWTPAHRAAHYGQLHALLQEAEADFAPIMKEVDADGMTAVDLLTEELDSLCTAKQSRKLNRRRIQQLSTRSHHTSIVRGAGEGGVLNSDDSSQEDGSDSEGGSMGRDRTRSTRISTTAPRGRGHSDRDHDAAGGSETEDGLGDGNSEEVDGDGETASDQEMFSTDNDDEDEEEDEDEDEDSVLLGLASRLGSAGGGSSLARSYASQPSHADDLSLYSLFMAASKAAASQLAAKRAQAVHSKHSSTPERRAVVYTWGQNDTHNLGHGDDKPRAHPQLLLLGTNTHSCLEVSMNKYHLLAVTSQGEVYVCGHGHSGRLGTGSESSSLVPTIPSSLRSIKVAHVAAGRDHSLLTSHSGTLYAMGSNKQGQLGIGGGMSKSTQPVAVRTLRAHQTFAIAAGATHSIVLTTAGLYAFGESCGQLGLSKHAFPRGSSVSTPQLVRFDGDLEHKLVSVSASDQASVCLTNRGVAVIFQHFTTLKMGRNQTRHGALYHARNVDFTSVKACDFGHVAMIDSTGAVWVCISQTLYRIRWAGAAAVSRARDIAIGVKQRTQLQILLLTTHGSLKQATCDLSIISKGKPITLTPVAQLHQATSIVCDPAGQSFAAIRRQKRHVLSLDLVRYWDLKPDTPTEPIMQAATESSASPSAGLTPDQASLVHEHRQRPIQFHNPFASAEPSVEAAEAGPSTLSLQGHRVGSGSGAAHGAYQQRNMQGQHGADDEEDEEEGDVEGDALALAPPVPPPPPPTFTVPVELEPLLPAVLEGKVKPCASQLKASLGQLMEYSCLLPDLLCEYAASDLLSDARVALLSVDLLNPIPLATRHKQNLLVPLLATFVWRQRDLNSFVLWAHSQAPLFVDSGFPHNLDHLSANAPDVVFVTPSQLSASTVFQSDETDTEQLDELSQGEETHLLSHAEGVDVTYAHYAILCRRPSALQLLSLMDSASKVVLNKGRVRYYVTTSLTTAELRYALATIYTSEMPSVSFQAGYLKQLTLAAWREMLYAHASTSVDQSGFALSDSDMSEEDSYSTAGSMSDGTITDFSDVDVGATADNAHGSELPAFVLPSVRPTHPAPSTATSRAAPIVATTKGEMPEDTGVVALQGAFACEPTEVSKLDDCIQEMIALADVLPLQTSEDPTVDQGLFDEFALLQDDDVDDGDEMDDVDDVDVEGTNDAAKTSEGGASNDLQAHDAPTLREVSETAHCVDGSNTAETDCTRSGMEAVFVPGMSTFHNAYPAWSKSSELGFQEVLVLLARLGCFEALDVLLDVAAYKLQSMALELKGSHEKACVAARRAIQSDVRAIKSWSKVIARFQAKRLRDGEHDDPWAKCRLLNKGLLRVSKGKKAADLTGKCVDVVELAHVKVFSTALPEERGQGKVDVDAVAVSCRDTVFYTSASLLAAASPYFEARLSMRWGKAPRTIEEDIDPEVWAVVHTFLHQGTAPLPKQNYRLLLDVFAYANYTLMQRLQELAELRLAKMLDISNVANMLEYAHALNAPQLLHSCFHFTMRNFEMLLCQNRLHGISQEILFQLSAFYRASFPRQRTLRLTTPALTRPLSLGVPMRGNTMYYTPEDQDPFAHIRLPVDRRSEVVIMLSNMGFEELAINEMLDRHGLTESGVQRAIQYLVEGIPPQGATANAQSGRKKGKKKRKKGGGLGTFSSDMVRSTSAASAAPATPKRTGDSKAKKSEASPTTNAATTKEKAHTTTTTASTASGANAVATAASTAPKEGEQNVSKLSSKAKRKVKQHEHQQDQQQGESSFASEVPVPATPVQPQSMEDILREETKRKETSGQKGASKGGSSRTLKGKKLSQKQRKQQQQQQHQQDLELGVFGTGSQAAPATVAWSTARQASSSKQDMSALLRTQSMQSTVPQHAPSSPPVARSHSSPSSGASGRSGQKRGWATPHALQLVDMPEVAAGARVGIADLQAAELRHRERKHRERHKSVVAIQIEEKALQELQQQLAQEAAEFDFFFEVRRASSAS